MSVPAELRDPVLWRLLKVWNSTETAFWYRLLMSPTDGDLRLEGARRSAQPSDSSDVAQHGHRHPTRSENLGT